MCEGCRGYIFLMFLLLRLKVHVCFDRRVDVSSRSCYTSPQLTGAAELKRLRVFCIVASFWSRPVIWVAVRVILITDLPRMCSIFGEWNSILMCDTFPGDVLRGEWKVKPIWSVFFFRPCVFSLKREKNHSSSKMNRVWPPSVRDIDTGTGDKRMDRIKNNQQSMKTKFSSDAIVNRTPWWHHITLLA